MKSKSFSDVILMNIVTKNLNTKTKFTDSSLTLRMTIYYNYFISPKVTKTNLNCLHVITFGTPSDVQSVGVPKVGFSYLFLLEVCLFLYQSLE